MMKPPLSRLLLGGAVADNTRTSPRSMVPRAGYSIDGKKRPASLNDRDMQEYLRFLMSTQGRDFPTTELPGDWNNIGQTVLRNDLVQGNSPSIVQVDIMPDAINDEKQYRASYPDETTSPQTRMQSVLGHEFGHVLDLQKLYETRLTNGEQSAQQAGQVLNLLGVLANQPAGTPQQRAAMRRDVDSMVDAPVFYEPGRTPEWRDDPLGSNNEKRAIVRQLLALPALKDHPLNKKNPTGFFR